MKLSWFVGLCICCLVDWSHRNHEARYVPFCGTFPACKQEFLAHTSGTKKHVLLCRNQPNFSTTMVNLERAGVGLSSDSPSCIAPQEFNTLLSLVSQFYGSQTGICGTHITQIFLKHYGTMFHTAPHGHHIFCTKNMTSHPSHSLLIWITICLASVQVW